MKNVLESHTKEDKCVCAKGKQARVKSRLEMKNDTLEKCQDGF